MRIRLVIDLQYPTASTSEEEELIKHRLSSQVMVAARTKQFNVLARDERETIKVEEIMVGCARVNMSPPVIATQTVDPGLPEQRPAIPMGQAGKINPETLEPNVYGDEDGDYWFASGHLGVDEMTAAVLAWEAEVADEIPSGDVDRLTHKTYYVVEDPENSEMYQLVDHDFPGAQPMTSIQRV